MTDSPSSVLLAAADRIRDLAAKAQPGPWGWTDYGDNAAFGRDQPADGTPVGTIAVVWKNELTPTPAADAAWIAALSPALAPALEALFREYARCAQSLDYDLNAAHDGRAMLDLARVILDSGVDTP
jgi:hypothetical protein